MRDRRKIQRVSERRGEGGKGQREGGKKQRVRDERRREETERE